MKTTNAIRLCALALLVVVVLAAGLGSVDIPPGRVIRAALSGLGVVDGSSVPESERLILFTVRFPRVLLLALVGGALAACGATLQATFQNGLADPGILGVSGGGALGAVLAIHLGLAERVFLALPACAFVGALFASLLVYFTAHLGGRPSTSSLLLTGVAIGTLASAGVSLVLIRAEEYRLRELLFWLVGGAEGRTWEHVELAAPPILAGTFALFVRHRHIDALMLGEEHALSVGLPVESSRMTLLALCALVSGAAVSVSGSIAFVGLIVPHAGRLMVGPRAKTLLPICFLGGAAFLVVCDLLARLASRRGEVHLGILTAFIGVPYFLYLLYRSKRTAV
ncbi:MAG: iron ABC transporter permease [Chloroflexi bacterium]|nr:iron ABC transporter permease [Chloroflexota bacterium]